MTAAFRTGDDPDRDRARRRRPRCGRWPAALRRLLYTVGIVGVGLLAIPTLAGSAAYAFAETLHWRQGLDQRFQGARAFYAVVVASSLCGVLLNFIGINPVKALVWSAVVNGVLSPFFLVGILLVASDRKIMKGQISSLPSRIVVGLTALAMFAAASIGMLWA